MLVILQLIFIGSSRAEGLKAQYIHLEALGVNETVGKGGAPQLLKQTNLVPALFCSLFWL